MKAEQIRSLIKAEPFKRFTMHLGDGRKIPVKHPEFVFVSPDGRTVFAYTTESECEIVDTLHIVSCKPVGTRSRSTPKRKKKS